MAKRSKPAEEFDRGIVYERLEPTDASSFSDPFSAPRVEDPLANVTFTREDYGLEKPSASSSTLARPLPDSSSRGGSSSSSSSSPASSWFSSAAPAGRKAAAPAAPRYLPHERRSLWGQASYNIGAREGCAPVRWGL